MGNSQTGVDVSFIIIDGKVVPVRFSAQRTGMYPDFDGAYPQPTDGGQLEDMVADFLKDMGVDLDEWDEDDDSGMGKQELVATIGDLLMKAKKKEAEDEDEEEDDDEEDEDEEDDDEEDEDEEDDDEEDDDEEDEPAGANRHPKSGRFIPKDKAAKQVLLVIDELLSKKHVGFANVAAGIAAKQGISLERAKAIAAVIGRRKYGKGKMAAAAGKGKALKESQAKHKAKD